MSDRMSQAELEARAAQFSSVDVKTCTDLRESFGSSRQWLLEVGPHRFLLVPFLREWWWFDPSHKEWRYTGHGPGEVRFVYDGERLSFVPVVAAAPAAEPAPATASAAAAKPAAARRFCPSCGARAEPSWKFCQSCGEKLPGGP